MTLFTGSSDTQHIRGIDIILLLCVFIIFYGVFYFLWCFLFKSRDDSALFHDK